MSFTKTWIKRFFPAPRPRASRSIPGHSRLTRRLILEQLEDRCLLSGGTWTTLARMPTPRNDPAVAQVNGILYVVGGTAASCNDFGTNEAYDPTTNTWTTKASMPTPRDQAVAGVVNGILYVVGGGANCSESRAVEAYNPATNTWAQKASMPLGGGMGVGVLNGILYAVSGDPVRGNPLEAYDPNTDTWSLKAPLPLALGIFPVVADNGLLYVIGGNQSGVGTVATVEAYDPITNTWTSKAPMSTPRAFLAAGVINGIIYAVGGENSAGFLTTAEAYDPADNTWTTVASMPTAKAEFGAAGLNGVLYAVGGWNGSVLATNEAFTPAPVAARSGPSNGVPGQPRTFTFSATDASTADQAAGFTYQITWGDGSPPQTISRSPGNGAGVALDHVYTAPGLYTVQVTATDILGGTSAPATGTVVVQPVQLQGDTLAVGGTLGNDTILLSPSDTAGHIAVTVNGVAQGSFLPTGHILVYGQSGNDTILLLPNLINGQYVQIGVPAVLFGGNGNDILSAAGSSANNVLVGGSGNNLLTGGTGRNILIAGSGTSTLVGGIGQDILIGGTTDFDHNLTALYAFMAEWGRTDASYATRVSHLNGSLAGGLNGSFFLNSTAVHGNANADHLIGGLGPDWFFAAANDLLFNVFPGEVVTNI